MKFHTGLLALATFLLLSVLPFRIEATTLLAVEFDDVVAKSEFVFEGRVVAQETRRSNSTGSPITFFTFQILDVLKGAGHDREYITLGFAGGTIDGKTVLVHGLRMPEMNERGIYFVESLDKSLFNPLYGWHQGHYLVVEDIATGVQRVRPVIDQDSPLTISPKTGNSVDSETKDLSVPTIHDFKAKVRAQLEETQ